MLTIEERRNNYCHVHYTNTVNFTDEGGYNYTACSELVRLTWADTCHGPSRNTGERTGVESTHILQGQVITMACIKQTNKITLL